MHRLRFISIAFMAVLAASFTIELPFTQVNYIHLLVNKKERGITNALKDTHRLHKTYYEDPANILPAAPLQIIPPPVPADHTPQNPNVCLHPVRACTHPNTLRGPPLIS